MQAHMDGDAGTRHMVDSWIGPNSNVGVSQETIRSLYDLILTITAEISTTVTTARLRKKQALFVHNRLFPKTRPSP